MPLDTILFVALVVGLFILIVGLAWSWQWRRNPKRFKNGFKDIRPGFNRRGDGRH